jgi:glycosyltransferase involved in cell wall biosynthesis
MTSVTGSAALPSLTVTVPVYNREGQLRRALASVAAQTMPDFECLVVDDGSTRPLKPIVDEFDDRFIYVRRDANGGCTASRHTGMSRARGEFFTSLDSDNELYPWALERGVHYLREHPEADGATGLYVFSDGLRRRVPGGVDVAGPQDYARQASRALRGDSVSVVRRSVVDEWLKLRSDYYNLDIIFVLRFRLSHRVVLVDEPWGRYDTTSTDKIASRADPRMFDDMVKFVDDFRPVIGSDPCAPVDLMLSGMWFRLIRAHQYDHAAVVGRWMHERGMSRTRIMAQELGWRAQARFARLAPVRA